MSSTRGERRGLVLVLGLLMPIACFNPDEEQPLDADTEDAGTTGDPADDESGSTGGDEAPPAEDLCPEYCGLIGDHCEGDFSQYSGDAICESVCSLMDPGDEGDVLGNSVACRAHHAFLAAESDDPHCFHAGPAGDTTCGGPCENFCSLAQAACPGNLSPFSDVDACIAECESWDPEPKYFAEVPDGDTYACRMHHLTLAAVDGDTHCDHIGTDSPVCSD